MCSKPNHPVEDYTFNSSDNVLSPYSLHQSNGKYHISDLFEKFKKGYPTLPPTFPPLIMIWIQSLNVHPAPFLSMMLPLSPVTLSIIRLMPPLFSPKVMLSMIMITTMMIMMIMILHPHLIMLFPSLIQTFKTLLTLIWMLARYIPKMSMDFGVEHVIEIITLSITANVIQPNSNILYIRCALMILMLG
jgi:hypothetical protein